MRPANLTDTVGFFAQGTRFDDAGEDWHNEPSKVEIVGVDNGILPGVPLVAEHLNHKLNRLDKLARYLDGIDALNWSSLLTQVNSILECMWFDGQSLIGMGGGTVRAFRSGAGNSIAVNESTGVGATIAVAVRVGGGVASASVCAGSNRVYHRTKGELGVWSEQTVIADSIPVRGSRCLEPSKMWWLTRETASNVLAIYSDQGTFATRVTSLTGAPAWTTIETGRVARSGGFRSQGQLMLATATRADVNYLFRSLDAGATWTYVSSHGISNAASVGVVRGLVGGRYQGNEAIYALTDYGRCYRYLEGVGAWVLVSSPSGAAFVDAVAVGSAIVAISGTAIWVSLDDGEDWQAVPGVAESDGATSSLSLLPLLGCATAHTYDTVPTSRAVMSQRTYTRVDRDDFDDAS